MKVLLFSTLYPSEQRPIHGIFVETRLRELMNTGRVDARVVAPVPWFPFKSDRFGEYAKFGATARHEIRHGLEVHHPRYFLPPRIGMTLAPFSMALGALGTVHRLRREGFDFELIDAHYYYPDGVAAALLARWFNTPLVVTARGTDLNLMPQYAIPRRLILNTAKLAGASIGVCQALMDQLHELGAEPGKLHTLRNGVDLKKFTPEPRGDARRRLGLDAGKRYLLSVGHLIERKGHFVAIDALALMAPDVCLLVVGEGPERAMLEAQAKRLGLGARVHFAGMVAQQDLKWWYSAADALTLCSSREGWANVLLESMACGTPVVATNIWGTPEVVSNPAAGVLMESRTPKALSQAWMKLVSAYPAREATRLHAESFSWESTTEGQWTLFEELVHAHRASAGRSFPTS